MHHSEDTVHIPEGQPLGVGVGLATGWRGANLQPFKGLASTFPHPPSTLYSLFPPSTPTNRFRPSILASVTTKFLIRNEKPTTQGVLFIPLPRHARPPFATAGKCSGHNITSRIMRVVPHPKTTKSMSINSILRSTKRYI